MLSFLSKNMSFEYNLLVEDIKNLNPTKINICKVKTLIVNCLFWLHYVFDEAQITDIGSCLQDKVLRFIRNLNLAIVTLINKYANLTSLKLVILL